MIFWFSTNSNRMNRSSVESTGRSVDTVTSVAAMVIVSSVRDLDLR